jgi:hypothetical protein
MTLYMHLTTLVLASTASAATLVALWAAESRRSWFWRALAVWSCAAVMVPIRAYEPALVLLVSLPLTALTLRAIAWTREQRVPTEGPTRDSFFMFRFGLSDALLAMALLGLYLAVIMHVSRRMTLESGWFRAKTLSEIALPAMAMTVVAACSWYVARGERRRVGVVCLAVAVGGFAWALWPRARWLYVLEEHLEVWHDLQPSPDADRLGFLITLIGLGEFAALIAVLTCSSALQFPGNRLQKSIRFALLTMIGIGLAAVYWQMLWPTPFPLPVESSPNYFGRITEIAERVRAINEDSLSANELEEFEPGIAHELRNLYDELLPLLAVPSALTADLSSEDAQQTRERVWTDGIRTTRIAGRALVAESKAAAGRGDLAQAVDFALANVRLGAANGRNGLMVDDLIGVAVMGFGYRELSTCRDDVDVETSQSLISALDSINKGRESTLTIMQRDMAYCERVYGWQCRLSNIIQRLTDGEPAKWKNFASYITAVRSWRTMNRLLQVDFAIRAFKYDRGRLPASLTELVPDVLATEALDPFTGQPFIYQATEDDKFTLYSVGKDGQDNDGRFTNLATYHRDEGYDLDLETLTRP